MKPTKEQQAAVSPRPLSAPTQVSEAKAIGPAEIWSRLSGRQQQLVFQTIVRMCQQLGQNGHREVGDEPR